MRSLPSIFLLLLGCCDVSGFATRNGFLYDREGRALLLRGVNVSNGQKRPPHLDFHGAEDFRRIHDEWGMNAVRFVLQWSAIEPEPGRYDEAYLSGVNERLLQLRDAGLYVVLDMHQDLYGAGFSGGNGAPVWTCTDDRYAAFVSRTPWLLGYTDPNVIACFDEFWRSSELQRAYREALRRLISAVGDNRAIVGVDPMNEPHWGSFGIAEFEADTLTSFYDDALEVVHELRPGWIAFIEPSSARNLGVATALRKTRHDHVVYAPHLYDPAAETGEGFDEARRSALVAHARALAEDARVLGTPLWVGEYGARGDSAGLAPYMDAAYDALAEALAGGMFWHFGRDGAYGIQDANGQDKEAVLDAIVRPFPQAVAGVPLAFSFDDATREVSFSWTPEARVSAPTLLALPVRTYPDGYEVSCDGCVHHSEGAILIITAPGDGRVSVRPR